ncbi:FecCD family ABC transporter permease [Aureivirga marina]|uniref:FecCD family ABC transporter permease n=1 Tax=Aureivirga marina TaxID=1182451 RepID=UPI0018C8F6EF|nr:iron ABC transporter permease [Aureivirga marina]
MYAVKSYKITFIWISLLLIFALLLNISVGSVTIPLKEVLQILIGEESSKSSWNYIVTNYRVPKAITAVLVGSGLGISGLLMQTLFRNPLAGPFVLGISSGASLGVALLILGSSFFGGLFGTILLSNWSLAIASSFGALLVLAAIMFTAAKIKNTMSILIIGLMFGSLTSAIINILSFFSSAEQLQQFLFWSFGSLGNLTWQELGVFALVYCIGISLCFLIIKPLNSLLLGENYAKSLGTNIRKTRNITIIITCVLTGVITAFSGPIAFIGLAVPHLTKLLYHTSNHKTLIPAVALSGAILMLFCDTIAQLPTSENVLPINAITSIFGAPIVIWLLTRKRKISY